MLEPALTVFLALLVPSVAVAQQMPGTLVDAGGYRVHLYCTGAGEPTVMLIGGFSFDWALVQPVIAKISRVCTYDPSGTAWSDKGPDPTCDNRVGEIHRVLGNAKIGGSLVLAGFSAGALFARLYARDYPQDVAAMVFIDHAFLPRTPAVAPATEPGGPDSPPAVISISPIDIGIEDEPGFNKLPQSVRDLHRWAMSRNPTRPDAELVKSCTAALEKASLRELPLFVISTANDTPGYEELQKKLLALSGHSRQFIADRSFHSIEISQPAVVIEAIREAIEATRK